MSNDSYIIYGGVRYDLQSPTTGRSAEDKLLCSNTDLKAAVKHDAEKPDMSLLSSIALIKTAEVMTFGKRKYSAHNWRGGFAWSRLLSAAMRHLVAYIGGENKDPETGLSHLAHCACCVMFLLEFEETHSSLDDRFKKPETSK